MTTPTETGEPRAPILSSVDNAWLATGLRIVTNAVPELADRTRAPSTPSMDFGVYYRPDKNRILFHITTDGTVVPPCCYDTVVSESRIADYVGIAKGELPRKEYYGRCDAPSPTPATTRSRRRARPASYAAPTTASSVFEGAYPYNADALVPSWGGSMFEALMPALFVPEERGAPAHGG